MAMLAFWQKCLIELRHLLGPDLGAHAAWFRDIQPIAWNKEKAQLTLSSSASKLPFIRAQLVEVIAQAAQRANVDVRVSIQLEPIQDECDAPRFERQPTCAEQALHRKTGLTSKFTFESYVFGLANQLAVAAAEHVAQTAGSQYNPLCISGGVGLGKTHLMHAIGLRYLSLHPKAKVLCVSARDLIHRLAVSSNKDSRSWEALEALDLLLIDDASLRDVETLATFFEHFVENGRQLVLVSEDNPRIQTSLTRILGKGLTVSIAEPDLEMRTAILLGKATVMNIQLPEEAAAFIAKRLKSNVRELEGALQQIVAYQQFHPGAVRSLSIDRIKIALRDLFQLSETFVTVDRIQQIVANYFKMPTSELVSKRKSHRVAFARQLAMYLAKELTPNSYPEIGEKFGGRDHAIVMHAVRKITQERERKIELDHEINILEQMIRG